MYFEVKKILKRIPLLLPAYRLIMGMCHSIVRQIKVIYFKGVQHRPFKSNPDSNLIVSLTSYPARIDTVWITIESIFQQRYKPWKVVLVLAEIEFPNKKLPLSLARQVKRGLEIVWVDRNTRSYKKLLPVKQAYPDAKIVTVDDDIIYESWRLSRLLAAAEEYPKNIIGFRGWEVSISNGDLNPYTTWKPANESTAKNLTLLTGVGGILYPPYVLKDALLFDIESAIALAPTADDIWFWAVALASSTPVHCLGYEKHFQISSNDHENSLSAINVFGGQNDIQLASVIKRFDLFKCLTLKPGICHASHY